MSRLVGIAANKRRQNGRLQVMLFSAIATPPLSAPVLGYVLFGAVRIDGHAEKLCREQIGSEIDSWGAVNIQFSECGSDTNPQIRR